MGNLTKEQLEKRLDEVLAELETERKKSSQLEIDIKGVREQLEARDVEIHDLTGQLELAMSRPSPASVDPAREVLLREKVRAGLSRKQAEEVIQAQEAEDARRAAIEDGED